MKFCVLHAEKVCDNCGECENRCELDPSKICDNCFRCLDRMTGGTGYSDIPVSAVYTEQDYIPEGERRPSGGDAVSDQPTLPVKHHYYDVTTLYGANGVRRGNRR